MRIVVVLLLGLLVPCFSKLISYEASSDVSQEQANNSAIAGIAKQISVNVAIQENLRQEESVLGTSTAFSENYSTSSKVRSNIDLKWVQVSSLPKENGFFRAQALLDLDEMTANIRFQLKKIQRNIETQEQNFSLALSRRDYGNAITLLSEINSNIEKYDLFLNQLSAVYPLNDSLLLIQNMNKLNEKLMLGLSAIRLEKGNLQCFPEKNEVVLDILVFDALGPLDHFPLAVYQEGKNIGNAKSVNGKVVFSLRNMNFSVGKHSIVVIPKMPKKVLKKVGLEGGVEFIYETKEKNSRKELHCYLDCVEPKQICMEINRLLVKNGFSMSKDSVASRLGMEIHSSIKNSTRLIDSYNVNLSIRGCGINMQGAAVGVGKNRDIAVVDAIQKMKLSN